MACLYLKDKENGKVLFLFSSLLDAYVRNINVFICASCFTDMHNKQQINQFHTEPYSPVHCLFSLAVNQEHQGHFEDGLALVLKSSRRHGSGFTTEKWQYDLGGFDAMWNVIW